MLTKLRQQIFILFDVSTDDLYHKFINITKELPTDDDDPMLIVLYPLCDNNKIIRERQNSVVGIAVFGNIKSIGR